MAASTSSAPQTRDQWLFDPTDMPYTPSVREAGLSEEAERTLRAKGVHMIFRMGEYLRV